MSEAQMRVNERGNMMKEAKLQTERWASKSRDMANTAELLKNKYVAKQAAKKATSWFC